MTAPELSPDAADLLRACCQALDDKKGEDIRVLYLGPRSSIADFFVLVTGNSQPHLRALQGALEEALKESGTSHQAEDASPESGWLAVDAFTVIFHLFTAEMRANYRLEALWRDADDIPLEQLGLAQPVGSATS